MGLAIDGNEVHGIAKGGQPFLAMQTNKDGSINFGGSLYAKQDPMVGKKFYINAGATIKYLSHIHYGFSISAETEAPNTVLAVLKDDGGTYYVYNTYEGSSGLCTYAYVSSTDTRM